MTDRPGHLWAVIQDWLDTFRYKPPSQRQLAPRLGVSVSTFGDYKYARSMPPPAFLVRLAEEMQVPYERVLSAALEDHGYRGESLRRIREELMGNAEHPAPTSKRRSSIDDDVTKALDTIDDLERDTTRAESPAGSPLDEARERSHGA